MKKGRKRARYLEYDDEDSNEDGIDDEDDEDWVEGDAGWARRTVGDEDDEEEEEEGEEEDEEEGGRRRVGVKGVPRTGKGKDATGGEEGGASERGEGPARARRVRPASASLSAMEEAVIREFDAYFGSDRSRKQVRQLQEAADAAERAVRAYEEEKAAATSSTTLLPEARADQEAGDEVLASLQGRATEARRAATRADARFQLEMVTDLYDMMDVIRDARDEARLEASRTSASALVPESVRAMTRMTCSRCGNDDPRNMVRDASLSVMVCGVCKTVLGEIPHEGDWTRHFEDSRDKDQTQVGDAPISFVSDYKNLEVRFGMAPGVSRSQQRELYQMQAKVSEAFEGQLKDRTGRTKEVTKDRQKLEAKRVIDTVGARLGINAGILKAAVETFAAFRDRREIVQRNSERQAACLILALHECGITHLADATPRLETTLSSSSSSSAAASAADDEPDAKRRRPSDGHHGAEGASGPSRAQKQPPAARAPTEEEIQEAERLGLLERPPPPPPAPTDPIAQRLLEAERLAQEVARRKRANNVERKSGVLNLAGMLRP
jgi:hypothetical protein